ncbi:MAG: toxic anion resistance protein [Clostridia bacterium]|nr:toxic anion resistance protein [Clostridia bacterium]
MDEEKQALEANTMPTLTLTPDLEETAEQEKEVPAVEPVILDESSFTPEEQKVIQDFAEKIDITNSTVVLQYGSAAQKKLSDFSENALSSVRTKDLGEVGNAITDLVGELKGFDVDENEKGIAGFFKKTANKITNLQAKYDKVENNVSRISNTLENHQVQLLKDIAMLDKMYDRNLANYKELGMYILAGKRKLKDVRENVLPEMMEKAKKTGDPADSQAANDMAAFCDRFEKKIHDLELTRMVSLQMAPQIRLVQNNDTLMAEKIQSTLTNTIPLWKSQMVLALGMEHSVQATKAQREVNEMTNTLLKKNAEKLHMATVETAKESERGIVDLETLKHTNQMLIQTLDEVVKIQDDGRTRRREAEAELARIEGELKQKLLDIRQ